MCMVRSKTVGPNGTAPARISDPPPLFSESATRYPVDMIRDARQAARVSCMNQFTPRTQVFKGGGSGRRRSGDANRPQPEHPKAINSVTAAFMKSLVPLGAGYCD